ncbi:MAG: STAS/SEC14 domain-containing protein [Candidatus Marinimicrobia bacterium]|nr:STAS/SEC14 domain-containing protein [Candidatus Neomarinimicrobiota bacterium]
MIELMKGLPDNVLGLNAIGELTAEDYKTVVMPAVAEKVGLYKKIRLIYVIGKEYKNFSIGAMFDDMKTGFSHLAIWEKVAIVTNIKWIVDGVRLWGFTVHGHFKVFSTDQIGQAREWISE